MANTDIISAFSAAISLAALFYLIKTYKAQQQQLNDAKASLKKQQFNSVFFDLLRSWNDYRNNQIQTFEVNETTHQKIDYIGYKFFEYILRSRLIKDFEELKDHPIYNHPDEYLPENVLCGYMRLDYRADLSYYFSLIDSLLRIIEFNLSDQKDRDEYVSLIYSQLSLHEKTLIYYCYFTVGYSKLTYLQRYKTALSEEFTIDEYIEWDYQIERSRFS